MFGGSERVEKTSQGRCLLGLKADYVNIPVRSSYIDRPRFRGGAAGIRTSAWFRLGYGTILLYVVIPLLSSLLPIRYSCYGGMAGAGGRPAGGFCMSFFVRLRHCPSISRSGRLSTTTGGWVSVIHGSWEAGGSWEPGTQ